MAPRTTSFLRTGVPDAALVQNASTPFDGPERQMVDKQIVDMQIALAKVLINGGVGTYAQIDAGSPNIAVGDVLCRSTTSRLTVTLATSAALAAVGAPLGVALGAGSPGARIPVAVAGVLDPALTGIVVVSPVIALARVSTAGRVESVAGYTMGDHPLGTIDAQGWLTLAIRPLMAPAVAVRLPFISGGSTSTETSSSTSAILTTRPVDIPAELDYGTSATFWVYAGRVDTLYGTYKVQLYNETDNASVVILTSSTTPAQLSSDVTASLLAAAEKVYSVRAWCADAAWTAGHAYALNAIVTNDGGKVYRCVTAGTSAGSGGPTGTGTGIADNTASWDYVAANGTVAVSQAELRIY